MSGKEYDYLLLDEIRYRIKLNVENNRTVLDTSIGGLSLRYHAGSISIIDKYQNGILFNNDGDQVASVVKEGTCVAFKYDYMNHSLYHILQDAPELKYLIDVLQNEMR